MSAAFALIAITAAALIVAVLVDACTGGLTAAEETSLR